MVQDWSKWDSTIRPIKIYQKKIAKTKDTKKEMNISDSDAESILIAGILIGLLTVILALIRIFFRLNIPPLFLIIGAALFVLLIYSYLWIMG